MFNNSVDDGVAQAQKSIVGMRNSILYEANFGRSILPASTQDNPQRLEVG